MKPSNKLLLTLCQYLAIQHRGVALAQNYYTFCDNQRATEFESDCERMDT